MKVVLSRSALLPFPRIVKDLPGALSRDGIRSLRVVCPAGEASFLNGDSFSRGRKIEFAAPVGPKLALVARVTRSGAEPAPVRWPTSDNPEAYRLRIDPRGIAVTANAPAGLQHGWTTLRQIAEDAGRRLPCGVIEDWPAIPWRLQHLDLKGVRPTPDYLMDLLDRFAAFKINGILLEIEDYVRYDSHPALAHPDALPKKFWREFAARARALHIEVAPLLQTWGHLQYILRKPAYRRLAETGAGMIGEICPEHPETWPMLCAMIDELCDLFPGKFFHVGLDEVFHHGECPRCRKLERRLGVNRFFIRQINRACGYVAGKGKIPIVWGDELARDLKPAEYKAVRNPVTVRSAHGAVEHPIVIVFAPGYGTDAESAAACNFRRGVKAISRRDSWVDQLVSGRTIGELDAEDRRLARRYVLAPGGEAVRPFYGLDYLRDMGFDVWSVPGVQYSAGVMGLAPDFFQRAGNLLANCQAVKRAGGSGVISSFWARGHSNVRNNAPFEAAWHGIGAFADFAWRPLESADIADFDRRWSRRFLGIDDYYPAHALYIFSSSERRTHHVGRDYTALARERLARALRAARRNRLFLEMADLGMRAHQLHLRMQRAQLEVDYLYPTLRWVPRAFVAKSLANIAAIERDYRSLKSAMLSLYPETIIRRDVEELVRAEVELNLERLRQIRELFRIGLRRMRRVDWQ